MLVYGMNLLWLPKGSVQRERRIYAGATYLPYFSAHWDSHDDKLHKNEIRLSTVIRRLRSRTWLLRPVHRTRLNLSLLEATLAIFLKTVMSLGGSVLGLYGKDMVVLAKRTVADVNWLMCGLMNLKVGTSDLVKVKERENMVRRGEVGMARLFGFVYALD